MKKHMLLTILTVTILIFGSVAASYAEIIPAYGEGQIGLQAVVLCENLTIREQPSASTRAVQVLHYGDRIIVQTQQNGWVDCFIGDDVNGGREGWVNADYIVIDPAWYRATEMTPVYAWNDTAALKVGLLDPGTTLPILKDTGDWLIVSLRGATGWIRK